MASTGAGAAGKPKRTAAPKRSSTRAPKGESVDPVDEPIETPTPTPAPSPRTGKKRGPYNVQRVEKKAATFRLPPDVFEYIEQARNEAAAHGDRLTNDEAITMAVRAFWGKKRQRRPGA